MSSDEHDGPNDSDHNDGPNGSGHNNDPTKERLTKSELPEVMRPSHVAKFLGDSRKRIYRLLNEGEIPAKSTGGMWYLDREIFLKWWEDQ